MKARGVGRNLGRVFESREYGGTGIAVCERQCDFSVLEMLLMKLLCNTRFWNCDRSDIRQGSHVFVVERSTC